jgi:hypothetical protein
MIAIAVSVPGCRDPQQPAVSEPDGFRAVYDPSQGVLEFRLESPNGGVSALRLVATALSFDSETRQVHARVAVRNAGDATALGPVAITVSDFVPADVRPLNAECPRDPCPTPDSARCAGPCVFDHQGTYGDDGTLEVGETSEPVEWILHNPSGESFAFRARLGGELEPENGTISGAVFEDRNGNGRRENDEPGVPGAQVVLVFGDVVRSTTTDARGLYRFEVSEPGLYEVFWRSAPDSCVPTTPKSLQVVILRRPDGSLSRFVNANFGCQSTTPHTDVPVVGSVFVDANENGQRDPGEVGVPGVLVVGSTPQCPTFAPIEARTDERGNYTLRLPDCDPPFVVHRAPLPGFVDTSPNPVTFESRPPPGAALSASFGVAPEGPLPTFFVEGVVFQDNNRNGVRDNNEPGIAGVQLTASGLLCFTPISAVAFTDHLGQYLLRGTDVRCPLPWLVQRHGPWTDTTSNPVILSEPPPDGGNTFHLDFGVAPLDSVPPPIPSYAIGGVVFADDNRNGMREAGEPGIAGVEIQLLSPCEVLRLTHTDAMGRYHFRPDVVGVCPVTGVWQSAPVFGENTTPNPLPVDPNTLPGPVLIADFGVFQGRTAP